MKKPLKILGTLIVAIVFLAACGNGGEEAGGDGTAEQINVSVGNSYFPFVYLDDEGEPAGYDVEVLKAVDEQLPQYEFVFNTYDFTSVLPSLDAGQSRIAGNQYKKTPEREANYLFGDESYYQDQYHIVTLADNEFAPETLSDLEGQTAYAITGSNLATMLEDYNANNEGQIDIVYGELNHDVIAQELRSGSVDAVVFSDLEYENLNKVNDGVFKISNEPFTTADTFFVFNQGDDELANDVDEAIRTLKENGTLEELNQSELIDKVRE